MKVKVSDSLDNVPNENDVTHLVTGRQTDQLTDQLLELLEWLLATKKQIYLIIFPERPDCYCRED